MMLLVLVAIVGALAAVNAEPNYSEGAWRKSLDAEGSCWTDRSCQRVMTTAHGGEWDLKHPYDSMPAFERAYDDGADAIKGDFRVAKDNVGMVMHSSPIEFYESLTCRGKLVEEMTSDECAKCQMELTTYTFVKVPDLLSWADGKVNVMFCVKESSDIPRAISSLVEYNATHRAFLEVGLGDFLALETAATPYWDQAYYVVHIDSHNDVVSLVNASPTQRQRAFLLEFDHWTEWADGDQDSLKADVAAAEASGFRTFAATRDSPITATVDEHLRLFHIGFDVAYTYNLTNAVIARQEVNLQNRITPP